MKGYTGLGTHLHSSENVLFPNSVEVLVIFFLLNSKLHTVFYVYFCMCVNFKIKHFEKENKMEQNSTFIHDKVTDTGLGSLL